MTSQPPAPVTAAPSAVPPAAAVPAQTAQAAHPPKALVSETPYAVRPLEPMNEAGAVALFSLNTPGGAEIKFTIRCRNGRELIDEIIDISKYAVEKGFKAPPPPTAAPRQTQAQAAQARNPAPPATPAGAKPAAAKPAAAAAQKGTAASGEPLILDAIIMEVTPGADDKVKFGFIAAGRQFADVYATWTVEKALAILGDTGAWDASHFVKHEKYAVNYRVTYKLGKPNSSGNPYKDIMKIELLEDAPPDPNQPDPGNPIYQ